MKYRLFDTEQEAFEVEAEMSTAMGFAKVGVNAKTGQPAPEAQVTERWAIPQQIQDGRWVFVSPDDEGVEAGSDWFSETYEP